MQEASESTSHLLAVGAESVGMPTAQFTVALRNEIAKWSQVIKTTRIKAD